MLKKLQGKIKKISKPTLESRLKGGQKGTFKKILDPSARNNIEMRKMVSLMKALDATEVTKTNHKFFVFEHNGETHAIDFPNPHPDNKIKSKYIDKARKTMKEIIENEQ